MHHNLSPSLTQSDMNLSTLETVSHHWTQLLSNRESFDSLPTPEILLFGNEKCDSKSKLLEALCNITLPSTRIAYLKITSIKSSSSRPWTSQLYVPETLNFDKSFANVITAPSQLILVLQ